MGNKNNCDAYDSGYCYLLGRPLSDEEDDICEYSCCYGPWNKCLSDKET